MHNLAAAGRPLHPNARMECTQCVSGLGKQGDVDTNLMEKVTALSVLCIRANLSPPTQSFLIIDQPDSLI